MSGFDASPPPLLRVIAGGEPTDEEMAALVAALTVVSAPAAARSMPTSRWADRGAALRRPWRPGPGAWQASARQV